MTRPIKDIMSDLSWKHRRLEDTQSHYDIIRLEADIERLEAEWVEAKAEEAKNPFMAMAGVAQQMTAEALSKHIDKLYLPTIKNIQENASVLCVASCTCMTKTNDVKFHEMGCRYFVAKKIESDAKRIEKMFDEIRELGKPK